MTTCRDGGSGGGRGSLACGERGERRGGSGERGGTTGMHSGISGDLLTAILGKCMWLGTHGSRVRIGRAYWRASLALVLESRECGVGLLLVCRVRVFGFVPLLVCSLPPCPAVLIFLFFPPHAGCPGVGVVSIMGYNAFTVLCFLVFSFFISLVFFFLSVHLLASRMPKTSRMSRERG